MKTHGWDGLKTCLIASVSRVRNQRGITLVELMVAAGIGTVVVLGSSYLMLDLGKLQTKSDQTFVLHSVRAELSNLILKEVGWNQVVAANPNMACFAQPTGCPTFTAPQPLQIPISGGVIDGANPAQGFTRQGLLCDSYSATSGNKHCPIGVSATWLALCNDALCENPQPNIVIRFFENSSGSAQKRLQSFDLSLFRDPKLQNAAVACTSMGGTMVGARCEIPALDTQCDPSTGSFVLGFAADGTVLCGKPTLNSCTGSDVGIGFRSNGELECAPGC